MNPIISHIVSSLSGVYSPEEAREIAFWLVEETTGMTRFDVSVCKDTINIPNIEIFLQRLRKKEPLQYILGTTQWMGLTLRVTPDTLIPRPETAELVEWVSASHPSSVLDIGTGSGCIAIALKQRFPKAKVQAVDFSEATLAVARENADRNHTDITFTKIDIFSEEAAALRADIVVSNPPYIPESERATMDANVLDYEPASALFVPDEDPLRFYRRIAELRLGRHLFFEVSEHYAQQTKLLLDNLGYIDTQIRLDSYGKERMVYGRIAE